MPGSLGHLTRRFFDYLAASPLDDAEIETVRTWLGDAEQKIFFEQSSRDQAHGFYAAQVVYADGGGGQSAVRAALLHDVGKRHASLGVIGRVLASLVIKLNLPLTRRMQLYRDHGPIGAEELRRINCEELVVDFARHHHASRPDSIDRKVWDLLQKADEPSNPVVGLQRR